MLHCGTCRTAVPDPIRPPLFVCPLRNMMPGIGAPKRQKPGHHGRVTDLFIININSLNEIQAVSRTLMGTRRLFAETLAPAVLLA
jgi:hypothetical protein